MRLYCSIRAFNISFKSVFLNVTNWSVFQNQVTNTYDAKLCALIPPFLIFLVSSAKLTSIDVLPSENQALCEYCIDVSNNKTLQIPQLKLIAFLESHVSRDSSLRNAY